MDRRVSSGPEAPRYRRLAAIASGGMGSVDLCLRIEGDFRRLVAVKRLLPLLRADESVRSMFLDEARVAGLVRHPNVVSVTDVGEDDDGPFLVMDYVEGMSLHAMRARLGGERVPASIAARIVADCARGLHAAHELRGHDGTWLGLVHRDVSPHNVLVGFDGQVKLTDFGISKAVGRQTRTSTGLLKGKLGYMAPEQLRFEEADRRSDVFALGVVLHELLTGERLFQGEPRIIAQKVLNGVIPKVRDIEPDVPEPLAELTARMLAMRADQRPATADEVAARLEEILREGTSEPSWSAVAEFGASRFGAERLKTSTAVAALIAAVDDGSDAPLEPSSASASDRGAPSAVDETAASTPTAIATRQPRRRRAVLWVIAACFVLTPLAMWAIDAAQTQDRPTSASSEPTPASEPRALEASAPSQTPAAPVAAGVIEGDGASISGELAIEREPAPEPPTAPVAAPRRSRDRARARGGDPMGRWDWE